MKYFEFYFKLNSGEEFHKDLLQQSLAEAGFDSFEDCVDGFRGYVAEQNYQEALFEESLNSFSGMFDFSFEKNDVQQRNWNEEWESNFSPIVIDDECYIRASFHDARPDYPYEIVIDPKMSFGTGHHQTTSMMLRFVLEDGAEGKSVLDMGCGTAIIAILAAKLGAKRVVAIDYDPVCYESSVENAAINGATMEVLCGSSEAIPDEQFDIIYANINRNILLDQLGRYAVALHVGAHLYLSGFYTEDISVLTDEASRYNLRLLDRKVTDNWTALKFVKA